MQTNDAMRQMLTFPFGEEAYLRQHSIMIASVFCYTEILRDPNECCDRGPQLSPIIIGKTNAP